MYDVEKDRQRVVAEIKKRGKYLDKIQGSMLGGAIGDALGYPVEFMNISDIKRRYGDKGITDYELVNGKALISDDTQMTLFTANGILLCDTRSSMKGTMGLPSGYVELTYCDWLKTQTTAYFSGREKTNDEFSWLLDVPELYARRAPGNTCLSTLSSINENKKAYRNYFENPINNSKGCGGVMRVAPLGLFCTSKNITEIDIEGARISAITHGHSLGYMPSSVLVHIINRLVYGSIASLKEIVLEARDTVAKIFADDKHINELVDIINLAVDLSENDDNDIENISRIGQGWVAEEALAIAIYCSLKYQNDFSSGIIAAVNHSGDSDSTGAITGNILGAHLGILLIESKWRSNLELSDVILEMAADGCHGCQMNEFGSYYDTDWVRKYMHMRWK